MWFTCGVPYRLWLDLYDDLTNPNKKDKKDKKEEGQ